MGALTYHADSTTVVVARLRRPVVVGRERRIVVELTDREMELVRRAIRKIQRAAKKDG